MPMRIINSHANSPSPPTHQNQTSISLTNGVLDDILNPWRNPACGTGLRDRIAGQDCGAGLGGINTSLVPLGCIGVNLRPII